MESISLHQAMYDWMQKRIEQGKLRINILDIETMQVKLENAGFNGGKTFTPEEMCNILGVDGVIISDYALKRPMTKNQAIAIGASINIWLPNTRAKVTMSAFDLRENKTIWNYDRKLSCLCSSDEFANQLMRPASKKMPYPVN